MVLWQTKHESGGPDVEEFITHYRTKISQILGIAYILLYAFSEKKLKSVPDVAEIMCSLGILLMIVAIVGRLWCAQYIAGRKTDSLVTDGIYSVCRNPLYLFSLIGALGTGLFTKSLVLTLVVLIVFSVIYPITIHNEEKKLLEIYGAAYRKYMSSVPRFIPKWSLFREPREYMVNTKIFRREMMDALAFPGVFLLLGIIEDLSEAGVIKAFFSLY
jgi:protein-S-isoprenylcysteine O-methyltransferase Ste14